MAIISGIVIGAVVAAVGALVNYVLAVRREQQRWDREDQRQQERWDREDRLRQEAWDHEHEFRDYQERRTTYSEFVASVDRLFAGGPNSEETLQEAFQEYRKCDAAVRLSAPPEILAAADRLGYVARGSRVGNAEYGGALQAFIKATRKDLGKEPEPWASENE
jgi:predicted acylesterase/phospholipase RssA